MCLCILARHYAGLFIDTKIDGLVNFIVYFNIDKVINNQEDTNVFKVAVRNDVEAKKVAKGRRGICFKSSYFCILIMPVKIIT